MGKKKAKPEPSYIQELLDKGTTVITAKTRDELAKIVNNLAIPCRYAAGAVGKDKETGFFSLRLNIINS